MTAAAALRRSRWRSWARWPGGTSTIRFGTRVLIPTYRHPVVLAKELATIDAIAGGRMLLGVGAGWMAEEFDAVDVPMEARFARTGRAHRA